MHHFSAFVLAGVISWSLCVTTVLAELDVSFLPERPTATLDLALKKAERAEKAVLLILFDERETPPKSMSYFFDAVSVKEAITKHFVPCVRDRDRPEVAAYRDTKDDLDWNRPKFFVLSPTGEVIYQGRILMNDETGRREISKSVEKWIAAKPRFFGKKPQ